MDKKIKILIADDSSFMRNILKSILQAQGFSNFVECSNGKECIKEFRSEKPDLVLLDIVMPEVDGLGVLRNIGTTAKVIIVSAIGQDQMIGESYPVVSREEFLSQPADLLKFDHRRIGIVRGVMVHLIVPRYVQRLHL